MNEHEVKEVVAIINNKGGVGKTTTVQNIAAYLTKEYKMRVLVIDLDAQGNLSSQMGWDSLPKEDRHETMYDALIAENNSADQELLPVYKSNSGIYYSPSSKSLQNVDALLERTLQPSMVLYGTFANPIKNYTGDKLSRVDDFDYILIDCPPALSRVTYNAMAVADSIIVPVLLEGMSASGLGNIILETTKVKKSLNKNLTIKAIVPTMIDLRSNIARIFLNDYLPNTYEGMMSKTTIRRCSKMNEAQTQEQDIFDYAPTCTAAEDYAALTKELFHDTLNK